MKWRTRILILVATVVVYVQIGHLFAYYFMYSNYFPKSVTAKILMPIPPPVRGSPFNDDTPDVMDPKGYGDFTTYYREDFPLRYLFVVMWPLMSVSIYIVVVLSWIIFGVYWVITGDLLWWLSLLP